MAYLVTDNNQTLEKIDITLGADTAPGSVLLVGEVAGVVEVGGVADETVAMTLNGTWEDTTADTFSVGDKVYRKTADGTIVKDSTDAQFIGTCFGAGTGWVTFLLGR